MGAYLLPSAGAAQKTMNSAMERLSSGLRINNAKDDAAGQGIATRLSAELVSLKMASRNASNAQSMIDTAEAAHQEVHQYANKNARDCSSGSKWYA